MSWILPLAPLFSITVITIFLNLTKWGMEKILGKMQKAKPQAHTHEFSGTSSQAAQKSAA